MLSEKTLTKRWIGLLATALPFLLLSCSLCGETLGGHALSPDNSIDAITIYRDCGATTSEYTRVILQPASGNHTDIKQTILEVRYHHEVELSWKSPSELTIICRTCSSKDVGLEIVKFRAVEITYVFGSRLASSIEIPNIRSSERQSHSSGHHAGNFQFVIEKY
jgi:hypothetical protein